MNVSVVVVTWNGLHLLQPCLRALQAQTIDHELVVVDNGSSDGTAEWVSTQLPQAKLLRLPTNLGFAGGNNAGLRMARGDFLVLVNNDTLPPPNFVEAITRPFSSRPELGSVAGVLTFAHRPELVASAGIDVAHDGVHRDARLLTRVEDLPPNPVEIFGPSGGAVCLRREALADVGLFPDRFFNYLEDADLAWRLRLRNWPCVLAPGARVPHVYSATSGHASPTKQRLLALNRWRVLIRCFPGRLLALCAIPIVRYELLAVTYGALTGNRSIVAGRLAALSELPLLRRERRRIMRDVTAGSDALMQWLSPAPRPREVLGLDRRVSAVLRDR